MAYDNIFRPGIYKAWNEAIIKEQKIRLKWHQDYGVNLGQKSFEESYDDERPEIPCLCKRKTDVSTELERKMDWPRKGATGTSTLLRVAETPSVMIPPTPIIKSILYEGISRDGKGRAGYLNKRWKTDPEERFRKQVCTSWEYGWKLGEENELSCNDYNNCAIREIAFGSK